MRIISVGGSVVAPDRINTDFILKLKDILKGEDFVIVIGGGKIARDYVSEVSDIIDDEAKDRIGIMATRLNAEVVGSIFGINVLYSPQKVDGNAVASGYKPGYSTDMVSVMFAEKNGVEEVINLTNVDHVYDRDPSEERAEPLKELSWKGMRDILGGEFTPGMNIPFDPVACKRAEELELRVVVMKGLDNLENYLKDSDFEGTVIR